MPRGENAGRRTQGELHQRQFCAYGNFAWAKQIATNVVSNQYLFDPDELAYIASNYVYTDHAQLADGVSRRFLSLEWHAIQRDR